MQSQQFPNTRIVTFLAGGIVLDNPPGPVVYVCPGLNAPSIGKFDIPRHSDLFKLIATLGPRLIACQIFTTRDEVEGIYPPQARALLGPEWFATHFVSQKWSSLSHRAMKASDMRLADRGRRIAFGLRASELRLLDLCVAYALQLKGVVIKEGTPGKRFDDLNTERVVNAIHGLFSEIAILRDTIADHLASEILPNQDGSGTSVRSMRGLRTMLLGGDSRHPLAAELLRATDPKGSPPGWIAQMSAYRNLFTHIAPLQHADVRMWSTLEVSPLQGAQVPSLYRPLPAKIFELLKSRSDGLAFDTFQDWLDASSNALPSRPENPDALEYLHEVLGKLTELAALSLSGVKYSTEPILLTEKDIVGNIERTIEPGL